MGVGQVIEELQYRLKSSSTSLALVTFKAISGAAIGLTLALIGEQIIGYGTFSFILVIVTITGAFMKVSRNWQVVGVAVTDLICILLGLLIRMYILVAPGG